jgi:Ca2+-binding RTX toxin-like protein/subtilisin-like proprotein convertase family protein
MLPFMDFAGQRELKMPRNWMDRLRQKLATNQARRKVARHRTPSEVLEVRTYLSVTSLFAGGELQIVSDGPDTITVGIDPLSPADVRVTVNGASDPTLGTIQASTVTSLIVVGSDTENVIDLSGVTAADFSFLDVNTGLGLQISVDGDDGNDVIIGSADLGGTLLGGDGADRITGSTIGDVINAGDGADSVDTGDGNDTVFGGDGPDTIVSGIGDDSIDAGDGSDSVIGGDGADTINGGDGADIIEGGLGNDDINGMSGLDSLLGEDGNDTVLGGAETDIISGGDGDDIVNGQAGNDIVNGDIGNDTALGGGGNDSLFGDDGDDILNGQSGNDTIAGDSGLDRIYGGGGNDSLNGGDDPDTIRGQSGNDTIMGGAGIDLLVGGSGDDFIGTPTSVSISDGTVIEGISSQIFFSANFDSGVPTEFSGSTNTEPVQSYAGIGTGTNLFAGNFLHNDSGGNPSDGGAVPQTPTTLTLTGLPSHSSIDVNFLLAMIGSWNSATDPQGPDFFNVLVDGRSVFRENFRNFAAFPSSQGYAPPMGTLLTPTLTDLFASPALPADRNDTAYNMSLEPAFDDIPHTGSTLTIEWIADGAGFEGQDNESWALDNVEVILNGLNPQAEAVFTVTVDGSDVVPVSVDFATADDSALAGFDYVETSGTLTFAPGQTQLTVTVPVVADAAAEGDEFFFVNLFNSSSNTDIIDFEGLGTIVDDDVTSGMISISSFPQNWNRDTSAMQWAVRIAPSLDMESLGTSTDTTVSESGHIPDVYILEVAEGGDLADLIEDLESMPGVVEFYPLEFVNAQVRAIPDDPLYIDQWHLNNTGQTGGTPGADANVDSAWDTYLGTGVTIGIVDDGLEHTHPDLANNYSAGLSFDYFDGDADPIADPANVDFHGTAVAGVAAADGFNTLGVSGAAPDATLAGIRLVAGFFTDQQSADALGHMTQQIDISNNSWGPPDNGVIQNVGPLTQAAMVNGATTGRGGLGTIYVWAGGNGGDLTDDNVNYDAFANSRYTIAVGAINDNGVRSIYSDPGAPLIVTAYSNDFFRAGITTTDLVGAEGYNSVADATDGDAQPNLDYTSTFGGTSSATPLVSGVIALTLEANPSLSYRDVNHILVNSARMTDSTNPDWAVNGAGHDVNHEYGFGAIDAAAAVSLAETWVNVGQEFASTSGTATVSAMIPDNDGTDVTSTVNIADNLSLEYVEVTLNATHSFRGNLEVVLTSPSGTQSVLAEQRPSDPFADYSNWTFTSARHWDEMSQGDWTLSVRDLVTGNTGTFDDWTLNVFGTLSTVAPPPIAPPNAVDSGDIVFGDSGNDTIFGNGGPDTINAGAGDDIVDGRGGDDVILGGAGRDTLDGGNGNDTVDGQGGADSLSGGAGDDTIIWDGQNDGNDTITSDNGGDTLRVGGKSTDDTFTVSQSGVGELIVAQGTASISVAGSGIEAGIESVVINGGSGNDTITITDIDRVGALVLTVNGGSGGDTVSASGASLGNLRLGINGDLGDDTLTGSADADTINGGDGSDIISGETGNDTLSGDDGNDSISGGEGNDVVDGNDGNDTALGDAGDDSLLGSFGSDMLTGGGGNDTIDGGFGNDLLNGMSGNDSLLGNFGNDRIAAGSGDDTVNGGNDNDTIQGHSGADLIDGSHGDDSILGQAENDTIFGDDGNDTIMGGNGNDVIYGEDGDDVIDGEAASDTIVGGDGNDTLRGGGSNDTITGDQGDDVINGNSGSDTASTGEGADVISSVETIDENFVLSTDLIQDFDTLAAQ